MRDNYDNGHLVTLIRVMLFTINMIIIIFIWIFQKQCDMRNVQFLSSSSYLCQ